MAQCLISDSDISCTCKSKRRKLLAVMNTEYVARLMPPVRHFRSVDDAKLYGSETVLRCFTLPLSLRLVSFLVFPLRVR
jgi:hypothetical protein